jgi:hypothetical protein
MIVNLVQDGWNVIYHRAHALLAAQIAGHWRRSDAPERFYETIAAISHHDDLEREWEGNHLSEAGAPLDFRLGQPGPEDENATPDAVAKHIEEARYRSRWVTLMTSMHICFLSQEQWGKSKEWNQFLDDQIALQQQYSQELGVEKDAVNRAYQFMRWCDRLSLILAQGKVPDAGRSLEITSGIDGQRYEVREIPDGKLTVEPWPFEDEQFTVNVETHHLSELKYDSNQALVTALKTAPVQVLHWTFVKQMS